MYINSRSEGLGVLQAGAAVGTIKTISNIVGGIFSSNVKRGWEGISSEDRSRIGGFFTVLFYINRGDRINYWHSYLAEMGGGSGDRAKEFGKRGRDLQTDTVTLAYNAGITSTPGYVSFTPGSKAQSLFELGCNSPVSTNGQWSPPADLVPIEAQATLTAAKTTTEAQIEQASAFPVVPMLIAGAALFLIGPKLFKAFKGR
jgi:hypothetical protein